jgi:hypothetical protein
MNVVAANAPSGVGSIASKILLEQRLKEAINEKEITEVSVCMCFIHFCPVGSFCYHLSQQLKNMYINSMYHVFSPLQ